MEHRCIHALNPFELEKSWKVVKDRQARPGRRLSDRRIPAADHRRVPWWSDEAWRLLTAYVFEEAGYVGTAADRRQAVAFATRLLPDVVAVAIGTGCGRDPGAALGRTDDPGHSDRGAHDVATLERGAPGAGSRRRDAPDTCRRRRPVGR